MRWWRRRQPLIIRARCQWGVWLVGVMFLGGIVLCIGPLSVSIRCRWW